MMKSVTVTYHAPPGDNKVAEAFGHTFFDGKPEQIEVDEAVVEKLQGNRHFECSKPEDAKPKPHDAKASKAEEDAVKAADAAKTAAQLPNPPQRGAILNPDKPKEDEDAKKDEPKPRQPDPKPQGH